MLTGCVVFRPYMMPIQQGNIITPKMIAKLKPGMSKQQVVYILGTPDITNPYQPNTLYYVYTNQHNYLPRSESQLIVTFKNDKLADISGNYPPPAKLQYKTVHNK